ncbi:MAG: type III secretion system chaperone [Achromobacter sp.]|uniref:type III secretion system chaperone n=1 Tax=Achromobacter sp. TaxID=134375 RepID=UPI003CFFE8AA
MSEERYHTALADLATHIGVPATALAARQELVIDGIAIALAYVDDGLGGAMQGACRIGTQPLPADPPAGLLPLLLQANTLGPATRGATLGLQQSGHLVLASRQPLDQPSARLAQAWRDLAEVSAAWATALDQGLGHPAGPR